MNRLYRLLAFGYFPKELPPIFTTRKFARLSLSLPDVDSYVGKRWQRSSPYLLQQKPHYRRKLDILCPQAILGQAHLIASHYDDIKAFFTEHPGNCSRPAFNRKTKFQRAVRPYAIGKGYTHRKLQLRSRFPLILKLDIKNYYRSVYTHSIPWAIHGKEYTKTHIREDNLGNNLDCAFQRGQDGQTIGIPTGPDTSFIISEIILCRMIDNMISQQRLRRDRFVRYYDDIEYGCESEEEAHRLLSAFENALRDFELEVNPDKVQILSGPREVDSPWLYRLRDIQWKEGLKADHLLEIFSFLAELSQRYPNDHVFRYFLRKMRTVVIEDTAWDVYQRILLSLLQENRGNAKEIFNQLSYYKAIGWRINRRALKEALDRKVLHQLARSVTSELSWAMYGYLLYDINISKKLVESILKGGDCPSRVLITKLIFDRKIALKSEVNTLVRSWGDDVLNSSEWLLAYEIFVNRWHNRYAKVELPDNRELFEFMRDNVISFIDNAEVGRVELPSIFKKYESSDETDEGEDDLEWDDFFADDEVEGETSEEDDDDVESASNSD